MIFAYIIIGWAIVTYILASLDVFLPSKDIKEDERKQLERLKANGWR